MRKKSRKVKAAAKSKLFMSKKKLRGNIPLANVESDSGPDVDSDSMYHDEIDDFHLKEDEKLSTDDELIQHDDSSSEEEEVLPITDDEKDNLSEEGKDEDEEIDEEEGLPNSEAWGKKKSWYYNADFVDEDRGKTYREEDAEAAKAEEEEALAIQKSVFNNINADNLGANLQFEESSASSEEDEEEKIYDWSSISKEEKLRYLKKISPEFLPYIEEFKEKMLEIKEKIEPLLKLVKEDKIPSKDFGNYIKLRYQILSCYCMNISFYAMLKCRGSVVSNHPVLQRIKTYKKLIDQLTPIEDKIKDDVNNSLENLKEHEDVSLNLNLYNTDLTSKVESISENEPKDSVSKQRKKKSKSKQKNTKDESEIISLYLDAKEKEQTEKQQPVSSDHDMEKEKEIPAENIEDGKRMITYQIAKNKGLVAHRKKEYRNPRVKHRMKFRKAKIRRKGQVREVVREMKRYEGEPTGISTHVVKSIKLK
ncbi:something about silencing protein 10-like [Uloborus diversus]|uniref:something about silencing protein 10-like n=1 Tax=Uloborus diversus TaxID=327109 RepID=UPI002409C2B6|nr:something about silencing protein 10-like [Uloborus diversus]